MGNILFLSPLLLIALLIIANKFLKIRKSCFYTLLSFFLFLTILFFVFDIQINFIDGAEYKKADKIENDEMKSAYSLDRKASFYRDQGDYLKAKDSFERSLDIKKNILGDNHLEVAITMNNLGWIYYQIDRYSDAEKMYNNSLRIKEDKLGKEHPSVGVTLNNMAILFESQGRYSKAEKLYLRDLKIGEKTLKENHPDFVKSLNNIGVLYLRMGRYVEAEQFLKRAVLIVNKNGSSRYPQAELIREHYEEVKNKISNKK